ncbi:MAG: RES domain-containing protein [Phenylobacterium sp.]|uniref:RES family NAD+ phosphorylase n=1 Tax=Phenylobacterium sp. TaxID=1871053 RepID=UPI0025E22775|nr:RES family NAD+ phosphorylase [Phenylobacterium sp.]MBA4010961.1 RES domain-containing protein [Phenylobacterium sp.]
MPWRLYSAGSPSLALLEVLVHLDLPPELIPIDYRLLAIHVPDGAPMERLDDLPVDPLVIGDDFLARGAALALLVPSAVVPQEVNALINPRHPAAEGLRVETNAPFRFDPRLF